MNEDLDAVQKCLAYGAKPNWRVADVSAHPICSQPSGTLKRLFCNIIHLVVLRALGCVRVMGVRVGVGVGVHVRVCACLSCIGIGECLCEHLFCCVLSTYQLVFEGPADARAPCAFVRPYTTHLVYTTVSGLHLSCSMVLAPVYSNSTSYKHPRMLINAQPMPCCTLPSGHTHIFSPTMKHLLLPLC